MIVDARTAGQPAPPVPIPQVLQHVQPEPPAQSAQRAPRAPRARAPRVQPAVPPPVHAVKPAARSYIPAFKLDVAAAMRSWDSYVE
jgi:hypothetical protein